jgi:hypothetical protein
MWKIAPIRSYGETLYQKFLTMTVLLFKIKCRAIYFLKLWIVLCDQKKYISYSQLTYNITNNLVSMLVPYIIKIFFHLKHIQVDKY